MTARIVRSWKRKPYRTFKFVKCVCVDASCRGSATRIGMVVFDAVGVKIEFHGELVRSMTSNDAEIFAIREALDRYPDLTVYSDSTSAVQFVNDPRAVWIPRGGNPAHKIASRWKA